MKNYLKQFAAWVTGLKRNVFEVARLRLTLFYVLTIGVIIAVFSVVVYYSLVQNLRDNFDGEFTEGQVQSQERIIARTADDLKKNIIVIDVIVLLTVGAFGYILSGKTLRSIKHILDAQKEFSANASHELRTPLAIIKTSTEVTLRSLRPSTENYKVALMSNLEEVERMSNIVENLLTLSRSEQLSTTKGVKLIDMARLATVVLAKMQDMAKAKHITLKLEKAETASVYGDRESLERVLFNLVHNAIKYTPDRGTVAVALRTEKGQVKLSIKDTGIGISEKDLPHIFKRFYKADSSESSQGAGLGLAIVEETVHLHRGTIEVTSILGRGTNTTVTLPFAS